MRLYQYANTVRVTTDYYVLYEDENMVISTSDKDPDIIITIYEKCYLYRSGDGLKHIRIKKDKINRPAWYLHEMN